MGDDLTVSWARLQKCIRRVGIFQVVPNVSQFRRNLKVLVCLQMKITFSITAERNAENHMTAENGSEILTLFSHGETAYKTRVIFLSSGIKISAVCSSVSSQSMRVMDRQTAGQTELRSPRPR